jgi:hypothetical protein
MSFWRLVVFCFAMDGPVPPVAAPRSQSPARSAGTVPFRFRR